MSANVQPAALFSIIYLVNFWVTLILKLTDKISMSSGTTLSVTDSAAGLWKYTDINVSNVISSPDSGRSDQWKLRHFFIN